MGLILRLISAACLGNVGGDTCKDSDNQVSKSPGGMS